eukprot:175657-Rhodomonas_salina.2
MRRCITVGGENDPHDTRTVGVRCSGTFEMSAGKATASEAVEGGVLLFSLWWCKRRPVQCDVVHFPDMFSFLPGHDMMVCTASRARVEGQVAGRGHFGRDDTEESESVGPYEPCP